MSVEPLGGKRLRFPPGRVEVRLDERYRQAYRRLYGHYQSYNAGLPVLRDRDFDGRPVRITIGELEALNAALARIDALKPAAPVPFAGQQAQRTSLFKRLQFLS